MLTQNFIGSLLKISIEVFLDVFDLPCLFQFEPEKLSSNISVEVDVDTEVLLDPLVNYLEGEAQRQDDEKRDNGCQDGSHVISLACLLRLYQVSCLVLTPKHSHILELLPLCWIVHVIACHLVEKHEVYHIAHADHYLYKCADPFVDSFPPLW